jgi:hypothetical protein
MLTAGCGRAAAASSSHSAAQRLSEASRPRRRPHTMTTQRGYHQLPPDGRSSRASSLSRPAWSSANHLSRRPSPSRPSAGPARPAPASSARLQPRQTTRRHEHGGRPRRPGYPKRTAAGPRHTPQPHSLSDTATHRHRTPDTGHLDAQAPVGHRMLAPDTGHRMPDTNADTVTAAQPASGPPWPPCRATAR